MVVEAATGITAVASKAVAAAQGPLHAIRGTGMAEKMLKNARTEYHNEFEEIGFYAGIQSLAETVGDKDTAKLARSIRREEERMAKFLAKQIEQLAKAVAREEIPAAERRNGGSSRRRSSRAHAARRAAHALLERQSTLGDQVEERIRKPVLRVTQVERIVLVTLARNGVAVRVRASRVRRRSSSSRAKSSRSGGSRPKTSSRSR